MIAIWPAVVLIAGVLLYVLPTNAKLQEIGRLMFACGLLVLTFTIAGHTLRLGL